MLRMPSTCSTLYSDTRTLVLAFASGYSYDLSTIASCWRLPLRHHTAARLLRVGRLLPWAVVVGRWRPCEPVAAIVQGQCCEGPEAYLRDCVLKSDEMMFYGALRPLLQPGNCSALGWGCRGQNLA